MSRRPIAAWFVAAFVAACGGEPEGVDAGGEPDASSDAVDAGQDEAPDAGPLDTPGAPPAPLPPPTLPAVPDRLEFGEPLDAESDDLGAGPVEAVADVGEGAVLVSGDGSVEWRAPDTLPNPLGDGHLRSAAVVGTTTLVATDTGVFALRGGRLAESPLQQSLGTHRAHTLLAAPGLADGRLGLWIACDDALFAWKDGGLREVVVRGLVAGGAKLAWGAPFRGRPALWVASGEALFGLVLRPDGLSAYRIRDGFPVSSLAAAPDGTVWLVSGGDLWSYATDGRWRWYRPDPPVVAVHAEAGAASVWLRHPDSVSVAFGGAFRRVRLGEAPLGGAGLSTYTGARGSLLVTDPARVLRVRTTREVWIDGPSPNAGIDVGAAPFEVRVRSRVPERESARTLLLDGSPVETDADGRAWIDPAPLAVGGHVLSAQVRFSDVPTPGTATLPFRVTTTFVPTWTADVAPLVASKCASCHGEGKFAHPMYRREDWLRTVDGLMEADRAVESTRSGRMPLGGPALSSAEVAMLEAWVNAGLPEGP